MAWPAGSSQDIPQRIIGEVARKHLGVPLAFVNTAGAAVRLDLHARRNVVRGNLIAHVGGVGVLLANGLGVHPFLGLIAGEILGYLTGIVAGLAYALCTGDPPRYGLWR